VNKRIVGIGQPKLMESKPVPILALRLLGFQALFNKVTKKVDPNWEASYDDLPMMEVISLRGQMMSRTRL
jgi:hypothetical protein